MRSENLGWEAYATTRARVHGEVHFQRVSMLDGGLRCPHAAGWQHTARSI